MMSKDQQEVQRQFIQKERDKIYKKNPKREFLKSLVNTHPDLAIANKQVFRRKPRRRF